MDNQNTRSESLGALDDKVKKIIQNQNEEKQKAEKKSEDKTNDNQNKQN